MKLMLLFSTPTPALTSRLAFARFLLAAVVWLLPSALFAQGSLTPPGAPAPTMKTLDQVEPRSSVQKLAGDATNSFIISQSGAYYLTGNINGASGKNGISIQADNVTIDLCGFAVIGAGGALKGIVVSGSRANIAVRNGTVRSWPGDGVDLSAANTIGVTDLQVNGNTGIGISTGDTSVITGCTSRQNGGDNIRVGSSSVVTKCSANSSAAGNGINASGGYSVISQCTANANNQHGINAFQRSRIADCVANNNLQSGMHITFTGTVERSFCNQNSICGILMDGGGFVDILNNNCSENGGSNTGAGIRVANAGGCRIEGNNLVVNYRGIDVLSGRNVIVRNVAVANSNADYSFVAGNSTGPVVNVVGVGDISATVGSNHPLANLRY